MSSRRTCQRLECKHVTMLPQKILTVDDDTIVQELLTLFLSDTYEVKHATTGAHALATLCDESVDLVVLDHRLPDSTGLDMLPKFRSVRPNLPVIMLTGYGSEWICAAAFKLGVSDYLGKPVSAVDLVRAVRRILPPCPCKSQLPSDHPISIRSKAPFCIPVEKAMALIQRRYWDHVSLSGVARQVGMSKHRLSHRFREVLGVTFRDFLMQVRLERAKALLTDGHAPITEIAQIVGFGDLPRFDKLFKRDTGLTPSAYRSLALSDATADKN